jgi:hypothetical protein
MSEYLVENSTNGHCTGAVPDATKTPVDSSGDYCRGFLEPWVKSPVFVTGVFEKTQFQSGVKRNYLNALLRDVVIELPDRARHWLDHINVGSVEAIKHIACGSRIRCRCVVNKYPSKHCPQEHRYGVQYPTLIEVISRPPVPEVVHAAPAPAPADPLAVLTELYDQVQKAGGNKSVRDLLAAVGLAGGWEAVERVRLLVGQLGGAEKLEQFLGMLKGD